MSPHPHPSKHRPMPYQYAEYYYTYNRYPSHSKPHPSGSPASHYQSATTDSEEQDYDDGPFYDYESSYDDDTASTTATISPTRRPSRPHYVSSTMNITPTRVTLPTRTARSLDPSTILILPTLIHVNLTLHHASYGRARVVPDKHFRLAVAGNMRLRNILKQLMGDVLDDYNVKVYVKTRGDWQQPGLDVRVGEIRKWGYVHGSGTEERGEIEIMIDLADKRENERERRERREQHGEKRGFKERERFWEYQRR